VSARLTDAERELIADACDAARDFGDTWIRFLRNGQESMLLPTIEGILSERAK
jgi:hypothetical protein